MCGFFQVIQRDKPIDRKVFLNSLSSMRHRGPDAQGYKFEEIQTTTSKIHIAFGHQRLSILDLDTRANQPFIDDENILLFNAEIYNYKTLKEIYQKKSTLYKTNSDTEVVAKTLSMKNFKDISKFNGMWALSFYDKKSSNIFLSRDRYGKKPLFYYLDENIFCVSSTIKAIKIYLNKIPKFTEKYLLNYLLFGDIFPTDSSQTHFDDINQILPGHHGYFDINKWKIIQNRYFDTCGANYQDDFSQDNLVKLLKQSVELRLTSDRPIALLLSGGIDSSLILSILHHYNLHENVTVFMGDTGRSDDYLYAKKCVNQLNIKAETIVSDYSSNAFDRFLQICANHEKAFPFNGNAIAMSQMYEEVSKNNIPVILDGSGGDEIFGGYWERHVPFALKDAAQTSQNDWIKSIKEYNNDKKLIQSSSKYLQEESTLKKFFNPFLKIPLKKLLEEKPLDPLKNGALDFEGALCKDISPGGRLGEWIWHNDRNSMMNSVESRSPFLDYELHSFIRSGYQNKFHENWNKYELRKVFDRFTPLPTQYRAQKQGFRWDGKHFFNKNKEQIIELIRKSEVLKEYSNKDFFSNVATQFPKILRSSIGKRFLGIAGVEYMMKRN